MKRYTFICKNCGKEYDLYLSDTQYKNDKYTKFCSIGCRNTRKHSTETKNKISKSVKEFNKKNFDIIKQKNIERKKDKIYVCKQCKKQFRTSDIRNTNSIKYCSNECKHKFLSEHTGGYRKGSGCGKHGFYKGIKCDSSYELAFLIYCLDHNIEIKRCNEYFNYEIDDKIHRYFPDFIINNKTFIEIKGYHTKLVDTKISAVNKPFKILYGEDLIDVFEYVCKTYNVCKNKIYTLYDKYKPKYKYVCDFCGKEFFSEHEKHTKIKFCSRSCAGKFSLKNFVKMDL